MMAVARSWHSPVQFDGPHPASREDIPALNQLFSEAFTERYRRDGMVGVRVPHLHSAIWRYALEDAGGGAMLWRGDRGVVAAFNIAHVSGVEGWMGPLAVHPDQQGSGNGKEIVHAGIEWLKARGARTIGLETMPRTMDNVGFYSGLGFEPGRLTITVTLDAAPADHSALLLGKLATADQDSEIVACRQMLDGVAPGYDFTREITLTRDLALGDTILLVADDRLVGFAVCHTVPLVEGRAREEVRVLKLVLAGDAHVPAMVRALADLARRVGARRVAIRVQGEYLALYRALIARGARVRWTDLRLTLAGYAEPARDAGIVLSNWEI
jgi:GNAT superfamily N-acetyltransferase